MAVMEAVAQRHHLPWGVAADGVGQQVECLARVPGRDELAGAGGRTAFLEMQIGHDQHALRRPMEAAAGIEHQPLAGEVERGSGHADGELSRSAAIQSIRRRTVSIAFCASSDVIVLEPVRP